MTPSRTIDRLIEIMTALRDPVDGCPWDIDQTFTSIAPYTIEEAYEVADAIDRGDFNDLRDELGDLLLQVVYHSRLAEEAGHFSFGDVVEAITAKMIRRHPHVFGDGETKPTNDSWEDIKAEERHQKAGGAPSSIVDDIAVALPGLRRAQKLQQRAAAVGFDWPNWKPVLDKVKEETEELETEISATERNQEQIEEELGDLLFSVANMARHLRVHPEEAMQRANRKFTRRIKAVEEVLAEAGSSMKSASLRDMEKAWQSAKRAERSG